MTRILILLAFLLSLGGPPAYALPIRTEILGPSLEPIGRANIYIDYIELLDLSGASQGRVGFANFEGEFRLLLVRDDGEQSWVGSAANRRLYDRTGKLLAFYDWTTFWIYVYAPDGARLGQAKCIAFRGACAAGVAGYLVGILNSDYAVPPPSPPAQAANSGTAPVTPPPVSF